MNNKKFARSCWTTFMMTGILAVEVWSLWEGPIAVTAVGLTPGIVIDGTTGEGDS